jgi:acyl carrier protein
MIFMSADLLDRIRTIAADTFDTPVEKINAESSPDSIEGWDSLTHLNFLLALEQSFDLELAPEEGDKIGEGIAKAVAVLETRLKGR